MNKRLTSQEFTQAFFHAFEANTIQNYVVPGLESILLGTYSGCTARLFHMTQQQMMYITPHSHKFPLRSVVLEGLVRHDVYVPAVNYPKPDDYELCIVKQQGVLGDYKTNATNVTRFRKQSQEYVAGGSYYLNAEDYHSVVFAKGTLVLILEGKHVEESSHLVPIVDNTPCSTLFTADWMFKKAKQ